MTPFEEGNAYCFAHVGGLVSLYMYLVQLITREHFTPEASSLVGEKMIPIDV